ncbi:MAG: hypothetical protein R3F61_34130 [Myxococcota bacterium]
MVALIALGVACVALWRSGRSGSPEPSAVLYLEIRQKLREVRARSAPLTLAMIRNPGEMESWEARDSVGEDLLCVYEDACAGNARRVCSVSG